MNAPEITKLTREEVDSLFDFGAKKRGPLTETLQSLGLIFGNDRAGYEITKSGRERLKRERILRDREEKDATVRREELEAARAAEIAKERNARIAATQKRDIAAQKKREADEEKLKARKQADQAAMAIS